MTCEAAAAINVDLLAAMVVLMGVMLLVFLLLLLLLLVSVANPSAAVLRLRPPMEGAASAALWVRRHRIDSSLSPSYTPAPVSGGVAAVAAVSFLLPAVAAARALGSLVRAKA